MRMDSYASAGVDDAFDWRLAGGHPVGLCSAVAIHASARDATADDPYRLAITLDNKRPPTDAGGLFRVAGTRSGLADQ